MEGGFIYVPEDERDYPICMAYDDSEEIEIPKKYKTSFQPPYENQGSTGNCVAQTLANIMEVMLFNYLGKHRNFSVGFIYGNRKIGQSKSSGMTGYTACGNLCEDGDVYRKYFEYLYEVPDVIEKVEEYKRDNPDWKDFTFIPDSYIRTKSTKEVKKFIYKYNIPVMAIVKVSKFWIGEGYHAMALYGWDGDTAFMQNSWGEKKAPIIELDFDDIKEFWLILPPFFPHFDDVPDIHWAFDEVLNCYCEGIAVSYVLRMAKISSK